MSSRVLIVDVSHIAHNFAQLPVNMSYTVDGNSVNTTIQSGIIKNINRWSNRGDNLTVVCFDRPCPARKMYFSSLQAELTGESVSYKGNRGYSNSAIISALNTAEYLLKQGGVATLSADGYEADDLVKASVDSAKAYYPNLPIDIVTNDTDLVPLVDEQVSVFLRSRKTTWAETRDIEKNKYVQITPDTYSEFIGQRSDYKNIYTPWNTVLLVKLLRGDPSDNIPGLKKKYPPKKVNSIIQEFSDWGILDRFTYGDADTLLGIVDALQHSSYIDPVDVKTLAKFWKGMNLNQSFNQRPSAQLRTAIPYYLESDLQTSVSALGIHL